MNENKRDELLKIDIPKGGYRFDFEGENVFIIKPLTIDVWKVAKKMIDAGKSTDAAVFIIDTLAVKGSAKAANIEETNIGLFLGLEQAVSELINPIEATIKKN